MLVIRLSRIGRKNLAYFQIVLQEKTQAPKSKAIELLGTLNPHTDPRTIQLKEDRVAYWLSQGAEPSATIHNLLVDKGLIKGAKVRSYTPKKKSVEGESASGGPKPEGEKAQAAPQTKVEAPKEEKPKE